MAARDVAKAQSEMRAFIKETGRKRRYYHITKEGRAALKEKLQSWSELCKAVDCVLRGSEG